MKGIKETDLKRIFGEVMFSEFISYMKGKTYAKIDNEPVYYLSDIYFFLFNYFSDNIRGMSKGYIYELEKVEIEV